MAEHLVTFDHQAEPETVPTGTLLTEAAHQAGIALSQPCGGQGRCGRCTVKVTTGHVRRRSTLRLSSEDVAAGYALACQAVVEGDVAVLIPPQETLERHLTTDRTVAAVAAPAGYNPAQDQSLQRFTLGLSPPSLDDQRDDWSRLQTAIRQKTGITDLHISLPLLSKIGAVLREGEWQITAVIDAPGEHQPHPARLIDLLPGELASETPLWGAAIDIGTTTVSVWLVDLLSGQVKQQVAEYNRQIRLGEDVISRIIYAGKNNGHVEMRDLVLATINDLLQRACRREGAKHHDVWRTTITGNSIMIHLLLGIPAGSIRESPFITGVNHIPLLTAREVGLEINPEAVVDCLPGIAGYVGADISAGVLSSGMDDNEQISLFMDIGTNGETVLGSKDWLVTCACSAGPAFEGAGVQHGMRATRGAIEEVWINGETFEPTVRVIGDVAPCGFCGSGLIALLAEMFLTGIIDKSGNFNTSLPTKRIRPGDHGWEYVVVWADGRPTSPEPVEGESFESNDDLTSSTNGRFPQGDIAITHVDIDNLIRAKAAIYAGFTVLAESVGVALDEVEQVLIGGAFGKYINVEKAVEIGLLPDMPWETFHFLGNTSILGAYYTLLDRQLRKRIAEISNRMTYIELSADNSFFEAFTSALFLPHTDLNRFPSVIKRLVVS